MVDAEGSVVRDLWSFRGAMPSWVFRGYIFPGGLRGGKPSWVLLLTKFGTASKEHGLPESELTLGLVYDRRVLFCLFSSGIASSSMIGPAGWGASSHCSCGPSVWSCSTPRFSRIGLRGWHVGFPGPSAQFSG